MFKEDANFGEGLLLAVVVSLVFLAGVAKHFAWQTAQMTWALMCVAAFGWLLAIRCLFKWEAFVDYANKKVEMVKCEFLTPGLIEARLTALAAEFDALCQREVKLQRNVDDDDETASEYLRAEIATAKVRFWRAHEAARELGFLVRERVSDYLPKK